MEKFLSKNFVKKRLGKTLSKILSKIFFEKIRRKYLLKIFSWKTFVETICRKNSLNKFRKIIRQNICQKFRPKYLSKKGSDHLGSWQISGFPIR